MNFKEEWREVLGAGNYVVSNLGDVLNVKTNKYIKKSIVTKGYIAVTVFKEVNNKYMTTKLHRIVAESFLEKIKGYVIDHIDNDKTNNKSNNLRYVSNRYNTLKQKLHSNKGFLGEVKNKNGTIRYITEYRIKSKKFLFSSLNKMECIEHYYNVMLRVDLSVCELIKEFYNLN